MFRPGKPISSFIYRCIRIKTPPSSGLVQVLLLAALLVSGCSGSSSGSVEESQPSDEVVVESEDDLDGGLAEGSTNVTAEQTISETTEDDEESTSSVDENLSTPDPIATQSTRVTFDITVPAYASDALQVLVAWGDREITAAWVTDESWIVADDLPTDT